MSADVEQGRIRRCANQQRSGGRPRPSKLQSTISTVDLALLDVIMPGMNGIELANHIQNADPRIKIALMSGYGPIGD
jgi:two-component SAPR family response regulator